MQQWLLYLHQLMMVVLLTERLHVLDIDNHCKLNIILLVNNKFDLNLMHETEKATEITIKQMQ